MLVTAADEASLPGFCVHYNIVVLTYPAYLQSYWSIPHWLLPPPPILRHTSLACHDIPPVKARPHFVTLQLTHRPLLLSWLIWSLHVVLMP